MQRPDPHPHRRRALLGLACGLALVGITGVGRAWQPSGSPSFTSATATPASPGTLVPTRISTRLVPIPIDRTVEVRVTRIATVVVTRIVNPDIEATQSALAEEWARTYLTPKPTTTPIPTPTPPWEGTLVTGADSQ